MELDPLIVKLLLDSAGYTTGLKTAGTTTTNVGGNIKSTLSGVGLGGVASFLSVTGAIAGTVAMLKACADMTMEYAETLKKMSLLNGVTEEEMARVIAVTGRYDVTLSDLDLASRTLAKEGMSLTIDTLKILADQYNALATADEKQAFLMATFGARGGTAFVELMQQGGQAIGEQAAGVNEALIPNQAFLDMTEDQKNATYDLSLAWKGFMLQVGVEILPGLTEIVTGLTPLVNQLKYIVDLIEFVYKFTPGGIGQAMKDWVESNSPGGSRATEKVGNRRLEAGYASGSQGWQTVPAGFPDDSYKVGLTSGETYAVNNTTNNNMIDYRKLARAIRDALNA